MSFFQKEKANRKGKMETEKKRPSIQRSASVTSFDRITPEQYKRELDRIRNLSFSRKHRKMLKKYKSLTQDERTMLEIIQQQPTMPFNSTE